jgi:hypothetical protein
MRSPAILIVLLLAAPAARAEIQKSGSQIFNRFQLGIHPGGAQVRFDDRSVGGYKFALDFAGKVKDTDKLTLWIGGGFNYTFGTYTTPPQNHDLQVWAFAMLTLEKLLKIPLVPFVRFGIGGDILLYETLVGNLAGGAFIFRLGGGIHYYIIRQLGLGFETNFTVGPGFYPAGVVPGGVGTVTSFYGNWDFMFGARVAF